MADEISAPASAGSAAGSSPAPNTATPAPATAAPATSAPAASVAPDATVVPSGEPPKERWPDILDNTRLKTRAEVEKEFRSKYGWADQVTANPMSFVESLAQHPQYGPQMIAHAARLLQARRGQQATAEEPAPDVPIVDGQGNVTGHTYSAAQLKKWREWDWAQKQSAFDQRLAPLEQMRTAIEQQAHHAQTVEGARATLETLRQNPYFKEHEAKVKQALIDHEEWGDNVHAAFNHVLMTEILPGLSQAEQRKVVDSLQQKASASTVAPSGNTPGQKPKFKNFAEAQRYYAAHPEEAEAMANR